MKKVATFKNLQNLGSEKISKLVFSFFASTIVGLLLNSIYNLTDTLFVSWGVGDVAMGGVSIVFPFMLIQGAISTTIGGGAASLISRKLGEDKPEDAGKITLNAMVVFYTTSVIITIIGLIFINPILKFLGVTDELFNYAKDYFVVILIGNVFSTGFSAIIRAEGKMLYAMMTWVVPITINIVLDAVFILVLSWGTRGSAAATVISQFFGFAMSMFFFLKISNQKFRNARLKWTTIGEIVKIGLPSLIQMGSLSITIALLNTILSKNSGTLGIVTFGYISKLVSYAITPFIAITQAIAPIVGYNYGVKKYDRVKETTNFCIKISMVVALIIFLIAEIIPQYLMMIFTKNPDVINLGTNGIRIISLTILFTPLPMIIGAKMQAIGKTMWALVMYGSNMIFILLPAIFMGKYLGATGVWWAYVIASLLSSTIALAKLIFDMLKERKLTKCLSGV